MFLILDCWDNFDYFKLNPEGKEEPVQIPLPVRFFGIRLDKIEKALDKGEAAIARKETEKLMKQIEGLPKSSVAIREAEDALQKVSDPNFWLALNHEKIEFLRSMIKPLFRTVSQTDFKAMRFKKDLLEASLAKLADETQKYETLKDNIVEIIGELPLSVNIVAREEKIIRLAQTNHFWAKATDDTFDELDAKLSSLMRYRDGDIQSLGITKLDLTDILKTKETVEFGPEHSAVSVFKYREMVEKLIIELTESNPILQKIRDGKEISEAETVELATLLHDEHPHITENLLQTVYQNRKARFIQFIRHILGLEVLESFAETVSKAFEEFIRKHSNLSSRQLAFLDLLKDFILKKERVSRKNLIESPFTLLHPEGIRGVFTPSEIKEILELTKKVAA